MSVLDASALLAWLQDETGADQVDAALHLGAHIHTVNWAEVLTKLASKGVRPAEVHWQLTERGILGQLLQIDPGVPDDATSVATLYSATRSAGLSLGDRYCLATGQRLGTPVLTTDRAWTTLNLPVTVQLLR